MPGFDAYRYFIAPILAFLPSALAYRFAVFFGDLICRLSVRARDRVLANLEEFSLGGPSLADRERVAKEFFRLRCCAAMEDLTLLRGPGPLEGAFIIEGLENLKRSLAEGKGVMLCGAHFGSYKSSVSFLGTRGFPATPLMRRPTSMAPGSSRISRLVFWAKSYALWRGFRRPNIPVQSGDSRADVTTAVIAAKYLRENEIVYANLDSTVLPESRSRAVASTFLGKPALFLPGAVSIARLSGAKVHIMLAYRSKDYRHLRVVISPALSIEGDVAEAFRRCLGIIDGAVRSDPADWEMWDLIPEQGTYFPGLKI